MVRWSFGPNPPPPLIAIGRSGGPLAAVVRWSSGPLAFATVVRWSSGALALADDAHAFRFIRFQEQTYWLGDGGDGGPVVIGGLPPSPP